MHVDTTRKFREMIAFRDRMTAALGLKLIVLIAACCPTSRSTLTAEMIDGRWNVCEFIAQCLVARANV